MATKRKRASFSPTIIIDAAKDREEKESSFQNISDEKEKPVLQQVVEVVVEEPKERFSSGEIPEKKVEQSNYEEELREKLRKELKEELKLELKKELEKEREKEGEEASPVEYKDEYVKESVEKEQEEEREQLGESQEQEEETEKQKETVAELFGKHSDNYMPEITIHKNTTSRGLLIWAITMVAIAIGVGGGLVIFTNSSNQVPNAFTSTPRGGNIAPVSSPTPTESPKPSPRPTAKELARKDIKIQVQNGGGVVGAGSKMKAFLEKKGYIVAEVGNAARYTYEETEIVIKASKSQFRDMLEEDLSASYVVGKVETTLPESSSYDVRVIVGKK